MTPDLPLLTRAVPSQSKPKRAHSAAYRILSGRCKKWWARWANAALALLIVLNVAAFVFSTVPPLDADFEGFFYGFEALSATVFVLEYAARVFVCTESRRFGSLGPVWGRLRYAVTLPAIVDLASVVPFFVELVASDTLPSLTFLRAFRLSRILKSERYTRAFSSVYRGAWCGVLAFAHSVRLRSASERRG